MKMAFLHSKTNGTKSILSNLILSKRLKNCPLTIKCFTQYHLYIGYMCTKLGCKTIPDLRNIPNLPMAIILQIDF